jgi:hypothetical protein
MFSRYVVKIFLGGDFGEEAQKKLTAGAPAAKGKNPDLGANEGECRYPLQSDRVEWLISRQPSMNHDR